MFIIFDWLWTIYCTMVYHFLFKWVYSCLTYRSCMRKKNIKGRKYTSFGSRPAGPGNFLFLLLRGVQWFTFPRPTVGLHVLLAGGTARSPDKSQPALRAIPLSVYFIYSKIIVVNPEWIRHAIHRLKLHVGQIETSSIVQSIYCLTSN